MWNGMRALLLVACLFAGCQRQKVWDERNSDNLQVRFTLATSWAEYVAALSDAQVDGKRIDITQCKTAEEFCSKWIHDGYERELMERDIWGRPFEWSVRTERERTMIRVTSYGRNGIDENGEGDDLYVEVTLVEGRQPHILLKDEEGHVQLLTRP